jgi:hypothetical protein
VSDNTRRRPLLPKFEAAIRENRRQSGESDIALAEFHNWLQWRYKATVDARVRKILGSRWKEYVPEVVNDVWSVAWEFIWTGEARSPIKKVLIRKLQGTSLQDARDCDCDVYCKCPLTEPPSASRLCHYLAQSIATSFRNRARNRDHDLSNKRQKARWEAAAAGETYVPDPDAPPETGPESVWIQDYCVQSARRFFGIVTDDRDVMEADPDSYDDSDTAFQPESYVVDLEEGANQEIKRKGWSTAPSLKPRPDVLTNVLAFDRAPAVLKKHGRNICRCRSNAVTCTCPRDPHSLEVFEIREAWKQSGRFQYNCNSSPIVRDATRAERDQWTNSTPEINIGKTNLKGYYSERLDYEEWEGRDGWDPPHIGWQASCSEARMVDEDDDEEMEEAVGMDDIVWLYHKTIGYSKLIRHLYDEAQRSWIAPKGKREPVLVSRADLSHEKWPKPKKPRKPRKTVVPIAAD